MFPEEWGLRSLQSRISEQLISHSLLFGRLPMAAYLWVSPS